MTEEEKRELERLRKLEADRQKKADDDRDREMRSGFMSFIKNNWGWGLIILALIAFFGVNKEAWGKVGEFLGDLVDKVISWLPEDWQDGAKKFGSWVKGLFGGNIRTTLEDMETPDFQKSFAESTGLTLDQAKIFVPNQTAQRELVGLIADANGGEVRTRDFTNDKTIYALMTRRPDIIQAVAAASVKPGADGKLSGKAQEILGALREIAKDQTKLTALFTTHKDTTLKIIEQVVPGMKPDSNEVRLLLAHGLTDNKANPFLSEMFTKMLTPADGKLPDPKTVVLAVAAKEPKIAKELIDASVRDLPEPQQVAVNALRAKIGDEKFGKVMEAVAGGKVQDALKIALHPENIHAIGEFVQAIKTFPAVAAQLPFKLDGLPRFIEATGLDAQRKPKPALVKLLNGVAANGLDMNKLPDMLSEYMRSQEVANTPGSLNALQTFVNTLDISKFSAEAKTKFESLKVRVNNISQAGLQMLSALDKEGVKIEEIQASFADMRSTFTTLFDQDRRKNLRDRGIDRLVALAGEENGFITAPNANALLTFFDSITTSPRYTGAAIYGTQKVLLAFADIMDGKTAKEAFNGIRPEQLATFFSNPDNTAALRTLCNTLDASKLRPEQRRVFAVLKRRLGTQDSAGFVDWLRDLGGSTDFLKIVLADDISKEIYAARNWHNVTRKGMLENYLQGLSPSTARHKEELTVIAEQLGLLTPDAPAPAAGQTAAAR